MFHLLFHGWNTWNRTWNMPPLASALPVLGDQLLTASAGPAPPVLRTSSQAAAAPCIGGGQGDTVTELLPTSHSPHQASDTRFGWLPRRNRPPFPGLFRTSSLLLFQCWYEIIDVVGECSGWAHRPGGVARPNSSGEGPLGRPEPGAWS